MAQPQLPPNPPPTMIQSWPSSPFQLMPPPFHSAVAVPQHHSWVEEFLDFSSARRNAHRRSETDPISFVESQIFGHDHNQECPNNGDSAIIDQCDNGNEGFEGLDDEQLKTMFSDDVPAVGGAGGPPLSSAPSTPSDEDGQDHEKVAPPPEGNLLPKSEPGEEDNSCKPAVNFTANPSADTIVDPKRIKRILANRQSAQRSRVRKLQYISELERSVTTLQTEVSALSPRVAFLDHQRLILNVDNTALKQRIAALAQDKLFKDAHQEALRKEIERLRQIYQEQNMKNLVANDQPTNESPQLQKGPTPNFTKNVMDQEYWVLPISERKKGEEIEIGDLLE